MVKVYLSKFTPGLKNGQKVGFDVGDKVIYGKNNIEITIDSELKKHSQASGDGTGYESIFSDTGEKAFAARVGITNWDGKI